MLDDTGWRSIGLILDAVKPVFWAMALTYGFGTPHAATLRPAALDVPMSRFNRSVDDFARAGRLTAMDAVHRAQDMYETLEPGRLNARVARAFGEATARP